jgi:hypothetical protein
VIGTLVSIPVVRSLLTGVLPGLALRIFVLLLPVLLYYLNRRAGAIGQAEMDGHVSGSAVNAGALLFPIGVAARSFDRVDLAKSLPASYRVLPLQMELSLCCIEASCVMLSCSCSCLLLLLLLFCAGRH